MFGISLTEGLVIAVIAFLVFGPDKLPELASKFGRILGSLRKTSDHYRREFYNSLYKPADDFKNRLNEEVSDIARTPEDALKKIEEKIKGNSNEQ